MDQDDNAEHRNTHSMLLPKAKAEGIVSTQDVQILKLTIGVIARREWTVGIKIKLILTQDKLLEK